MMLGMKRICRVPEKKEIVNRNCVHLFESSHIILRSGSKVRIAKEELDKMSKEDLHKSWLLQEQYVDYVEAKLNENTDHSELMNLRESEEKLKQQQLEAIRKENILVMRLTTKEQEMQEYAGQIQELKQSQIPSIAQLRSALLDPAVNLMFDRMRREIDSLKARLEETQNELNAWKFTPDSGTGKRLMAKCRLLYQENEELGKMISSGRIAKLEGDLALQKSFSEEMKKSQRELDDFLLELDEDLEGLQSTVCFLQQQLRESKDQIQKLQKENEELSTLSGRPPINHFIEQEVHKEFKVERIKEEPPITTEAVISSDSSNINISSASPKTPDLNRTEEMMNPKPSRGTNSGRPWSPPPISTASEIEEPKIENHQKSEDIEKERHPVKQLSPLHKTANQEPTPIIENAVNAVPSHLITIPAVRGSLHVEEYDSEQETEPIRAVEDNSVSLGNTLSSGVDETRVPVIVEPQQMKGNLSTEKPQPATNKRTTENCNSTRGRKRTRGSKLVTLGHNDDSISEQPTVKRLRRREIILEHDIHDTSECTRTPLDIDNTDTEVEVAQTLVNLAAAKKDRKDIHNNSQDMLTETLGNGELLKGKSKAEKA